MERRFLPVASRPVGIVQRADGGKMVCGYASVFFQEGDPGTQYQLDRDLYERIMPTAFSRALAEKDDCRALVNHEPSLILGRTTAGTCRLSVDGTGLRYEVDPPDTQVGRDTMTSIARGDLTGSSFGFAVEKQSWREEEDADGAYRVLRCIESVRLHDVSVVTYPAYDATSAGLRAADLMEVRSAYQAWVADQRGAVPYAAGPTLDSDTWDGPAAEKLVRSWASKGDTMDWAKYRRAFAWYDAKDAETLGAYKLIHHTIRDGALVVHRKGVIAAMTALLGGRGGTDLPEGDRKAVFSHLARHYAQFDLEPPEYHSSVQIKLAEYRDRAYQVLADRVE